MRGTALTVLIVVGLLFLDIGQRVHMITLGYEIERLQKTHQELKKTRQELLVERETLSSLDRIERIAVQRLGMKRPESGQIVQVVVEEIPSGVSARGARPKDKPPLRVAGRP
jgi:cell division protein FtsL